MPKKKLSLAGLKVQSFVTNINYSSHRYLAGNDGDVTEPGCTSPDQCNTGNICNSIDGICPPTNPYDCSVAPVICAPTKSCVICTGPICPFDG